MTAPSARAVGVGLPARQGWLSLPAIGPGLQSPPHAATPPSLQPGVAARVRRAKHQGDLA